jgi:hypothetical protein
MATQPEPDLHVQQDKSIVKIIENLNNLSSAHHQVVKIKCNTSKIRLSEELCHDDLGKSFKNGH